MRVGIGKTEICNVLLSRSAAAAKKTLDARVDQRGQRKVGQVIASLPMRCESS
jgi:hypothetical protein